VRQRAGEPTIDLKGHPMIPYDIDPSLHDAQPQDTLEDGFSPRSHHDEAAPAAAHAQECELEAALAAKSPF
jgi:hypothetical protein